MQADTTPRLYLMLSTTLFSNADIDFRLLLRNGQIWQEQAMRHKVPLKLTQMLNIPNGDGAAQHREKCASVRGSPPATELKQLQHSQHCTAADARFSSWLVWVKASRKKILPCNQRFCQTPCATFSASECTESCAGVTEHRQPEALSHNY